MKKIKITLTILIVAVIASVTACFFGGCDFIKYVEKTDNNTAISKEMEELQSEYVDKLLSVTSQTEYRDTERKIFEYAVLDAENELRECRSEEDLKRVYEKHLAIIGNIKTDEEYTREEEENAVKAYRSAVLTQARESYDKSKYIESQVTYLDGVFATFSNHIEGTDDKDEMTALLQGFYFDLNKENEISALINYVDVSDYEEVQKDILTAVLDKCTEDIRDCTAEEEIAEIKSVYVFEVYKQNTVKKLKEYVDLQLYREEQAEEIKTILSEHLNLAEKAANAVEADNVFREYQIAVYDVPTDETLYAEELDKLKEELNSALSDTYKLSLYRENEGRAVQDLLQFFQSSLSAIAKKEDVLSQYLLVKNRLDCIKTASELDAEERVNLIEELYVQIKEKIENSIEEADKEEYYIKAEAVYSVMCDRISLEGIRQEYRAFVKEIAGATIGYVRDELNEFNSDVFYREREAEEVNAIKEEYLQLITDDLELEAAKSILQEAKDKISEVKTNDDLWNDSVAEFRAALQTLYGDAVLEEPRSLTEANDRYELADIIDYYAYYQLSGTEFVCDAFRVKLNFGHDDAESEINGVYWQCELLRSGAGIYGQLEQSHYLVLHLIPYNLASMSNRETTARIENRKSLIEYKGEGQTTARGVDFDDFPYKSYTKQIKGIWSTQQLWYALEHEYNPVCVAGSPAEQTLSKAKDILRGIVREGMSEEEKIFNIYSWFGDNVQYDYQYSNGFYQSVLERFPEAATSKAFHAEGALIDGLAVCEGYAKSYLLLLRLEGIESYRIVMSTAVRSRIIPNANGEKFYENYLVGYGSHAFVGIKMSDGLLYYSDAEQSFASEAHQELLMLQQFMVPSSLFTGYWGGTFLKPDIAEGSAYWSGYENLYLGSVSLFVHNKEELTALADIIKEQFADNSDVCISIYCDLSVYTSFSEDFSSLLDYDYIKKSSKNNSCEFAEYIIF